MASFTRAAAYAVAALTVALSPTLADPASAWQAAPAPLAAHYLAHAAAETDSGVLPTSRPAALQPPQPQAQTDVAAPATPAPRSLAELVDDHHDAELADAEQECLAGAIYFESKGEPLEGQLAVAEVVINRSKSGKFPSTICGVVKQRRQFSFVRGGRFPPIARNSPAWRKAVAIAHIALADLADSRAGQAMFFHATYVSPGWRGLKRVARLGNHIFYR